ncbi:MAG TPA: acetate--CoA ligase family protein, partial [Marmoricola sp.]|nr:acetate--CoA ligase family protein [Marmoricola sp.]
VGNKADVSGNDLLQYWEDDPRTDVILLYLESFGNPRKFARVARTFAQRKPLLAVAGGRSGGGARAGASHTAAAASPAVHVSALFAQAGVLGCASAEEMAEAALMLTRQPLPTGRRVAIVTNAGGLGVIAADAADRLLLTVPELSTELRHRVATSVRGTAATANPVDAGAGVEPGDLDGLVEDLLGSDEVDALVAVVVPTRISDGAGAVRRLLELARRPRAKPMAVVPVGSLWTRTWVPGSPAFPSAEAALRALAHAATYAAWRDVPAVDPLPLDHARASTALAFAHESERAHPDGRGWLCARSVDTLLSPYRLAPIGVVADGADEAAAAAARLGFPVAVKAGSGEVVHKTEHGLVRLGLRAAGDVRAAVTQIEELLPGQETSVLVQPMSAGTELALGVVRDDRFGPLVMAAAGGIHTDVWQDRSFLMPPVSRDAAERAVRALRLYPVLAGHRGTPPADVEGVIDLILRIGLLVEEVPDVAELDINPVHVDAHGCRIIDVKVRVAPGRLLDAGVPRRLRDR